MALVDTFVEGRGDEAREVKRVRFKLCDKLGALRELGRHPCRCPQDAPPRLYDQSAEAQANRGAVRLGQDHRRTRPADAARSCALEIQTSEQITPSHHADAYSSDDLRGTGPGRPCVACFEWQSCRGCGFAAIREKFVHDLLLACQQQPIGRGGERETTIRPLAPLGCRQALCGV
jgi:hypothetical protein